MVYAKHLGLAKPETDEDAGAKEGNGPKCTYCRALVEVEPGCDEEPPVCIACRESIQESYDDTEPSFAERTGKRFDQFVFCFFVLMIAVIVITLFASK